METIETKTGEFKLACNPLHANDMPKLLAVSAFADAVPLMSFDAIKQHLETVPRVDTISRFGGYVKNQGRRGSCGGYAGAKALQRARVRRGLPFVSLSGEGVYAAANGGQDNGTLLVDVARVLEERGAPLEAEVPHEEYRMSAIPSAVWQRALSYRGHELYRVSTEQELATALALDFDCVVAVHVTDNWQKMLSDNLIPPCYGVGNHAVGLDNIRYNTRYSRLEYLHYGSWGSEMHVNGYAWLAWDWHLASTNPHHGFYAIRSTVDDDKPPALN